ncbi:MAG: hypothetical protein QXY01_07445 [Candidatus Bathyarchaeia archaeon]
MVNHPSAEVEGFPARSPINCPTWLRKKGSDLSPPDSKMKITGFHPGHFTPSRTIPVRESWTAKNERRVSRTPRGTQRLRLKPIGKLIAWLKPWMRESGGEASDNSSPP